VIFKLKKKEKDVKEGIKAIILAPSLELS